MSAMEWLWLAIKVLLLFAQRWLTIDNEKRARRKEGSQIISKALKSKTISSEERLRQVREGFEKCKG